MVWLQALAFFVAGALVGALVLYFLLPARRQYGRLMRERNEAQKDLAQYRAEVDQHFVQTAELVNRLTDSYRQVHEHLSHGARDLCSESGRRMAADASLNALPDDESLYEDSPGRGQPLDYAPSASGTLAEGYGLEEGSEASSGADESARPPLDYAAADENASARDEGASRSKA